VPSTLTVQNNLDSGAGSLRAAIAAAHIRDTIVFAPSLDGQTITLTSGELFIKQDVTIAGPGADQLTISGNHASRVFELSSTTKPQVTLSGMTISNGVGVLAAGSSDSNDGYGGAILNFGTLTISNCILSGNSAGSGGAIINNNPGKTKGVLTVIGSTLTGNTAHVGGAITSYGTLTVSASTLSHNSALSAGGGIYNFGTATVSATTLSDNSAPNGGGIYGGVTLTLSGCTLSGNSALPVRGGPGQGGGIAITAGTLTLSGCTLTGNSATDAGGGIGIWPHVTVTVKDSSSITGNTGPVGLDTSTPTAASTPPSARRTPAW
jgi:hypothetical protein